MIIDSYLHKKWLKEIVRNGDSIKDVHETLATFLHNREYINKQMVKIFCAIILLFTLVTFVVYRSGFKENIMNSIYASLNCGMITFIVILIYLFILQIKEDFYNSKYKNYAMIDLRDILGPEIEIFINNESRTISCKGKNNRSSNFLIDEKGRIENNDIIITRDMISFKQLLESNFSKVVYNNTNT